MEALFFYILNKNKEYCWQEKKFYGEKVAVSFRKGNLEIKQNGQYKKI